MKVTKFSGDIVDFDIQKLKKSLLKSGANQQVVDAVLKQIKSQLYDGIPTKKIYKIAFDLLKKQTDSSAAQYNLRASLQMLGPAGFYFEKYISMLFRKLGYHTRMNLILSGKCVTHEVDIVLQMQQQLTMVECKYHSSRDSVTDVKVPMYILSRFNDLKNKPQVIFDENQFINHCLIVTNNRFSEDAVKFSYCYGLELLSWDLPEEKTLRNLIDSSRLFPVTCLTTITQKEKEQLLMQEIILAEQLKSNRESLEFIGISSNRIENIFKEVNALCN